MNRPAGVFVRLAAMVYEGVLLFGVTFAAVLAFLALSGWSGPLEGWRRIGLQTVLFAAIGAYFVACWTRSGQTLALKTWKLRVVDPHGRPPSAARAVARYLLSWTLLLPGLAYVAVAEPTRAGGLAALAISLGMMLIPALFDPQHRLMHDRWTRTRIANEG